MGLLEVDTKTECQADQAAVQRCEGLERRLVRSEYMDGFRDCARCFQTQYILRWHWLCLLRGRSLHRY